jgi:hypothetical protein|nr:MAG TPA: hypothetical protein [Caudoviricetes sp.]
MDKKDNNEFYRNEIIKLLKDCNSEQFLNFIYKIRYEF